MKKRRLLLFVAITAIWLQGFAQIRYEQWLGGNRASAQWGNLILGEQTFTVDVASIPYPGLHFLNIMPYDESGEPGVWRCIPFLMPEYWPDTNNATQIEYWVTGYDQKPHRQPYAGTAVTLDIDASHFSPGMHFLNYRTLNEQGEGGGWKCIAFMIPEAWPGTTEATQIEYWVTSYDKEPTRKPYTGGEISFNIDICQMSYGLHFFNFRTINEEGEAGPWKQVLFYISNGLFDPEGINYEYWIDDQDAIISTGYYPGIMALEIDVDGLDAGVHTFNFRGQNWIGAYGETFSVQFEIEEPDDIEDVNAESDAESVIYDLQGRRVERVIQKGIYIINDKKVMKK